MDFSNVLPMGFQFMPMPPPCPHIHQAVNPLRDSLSPAVPVHMSPTGETICARCNVSYCCRALFMLHLETSLVHNLCVLCHYTKDFPTFTQLQDHLEQEHLWCEPCNWFAPSYEGLMQHFQRMHLMCPICKEVFRNLNEFTGHANTHRPLTVPCFLCPEKFALRSAAFNHIESGTCSGGATEDDIRFVVKNFWANLSPEHKRYWVSDSHLFTCPPCHKQYQRLSDLLQHKETKSCPGGYNSEGNSMTDRMVQYVQEQLPVLIEKRKQEGKLEAGIQKPKLVAPAAVVHPRVHILRRGH